MLLSLRIRYFAKYQGSLQTNRPTSCFAELEILCTPWVVCKVTTANAKFMHRISIDEVQSQTVSLVAQHTCFALRYMCVCLSEIWKQEAMEFFFFSILRLIQRL